MPKLKTNKSASKRFSRTKTGKLRRGKAYHRHLMGSKSPKRRRNLRKSTILSPVDAARVRRMLPT